MNTPRCPPHRYCLKCNPRAMYLDPKPAIDRVACPRCQESVLVTLLQEHLQTCPGKEGL